MNNIIYSWNINIAKKLLSSPEELPHALLFYGQQGIGKLSFVRFLAQSLLCESKIENGFACNQCASCKWFAQDYHPDFKLIEPEGLTDESKSDKKSSIIAIDQIRALSDFVNTSSHRRGLKIILVQPAEAMNSASANALLKTLEEPPPGVFIFLISHQIERLLPTIQSRCHKIPMSIPERSISEAWLKEQGIEDPALYLAQAGYAPLAALEINLQQKDRLYFLTQLANPKSLDPIILAQTLQSLETGKWLYWLTTWIYDITLAQLAGEIRYHIDYKKEIFYLAKHVVIINIIQYYKQLINLKPIVNHPLNIKLLAEQVLINYAKSFGK